MCRLHWPLVSPAHQRAVTRAYVPGQEATQTPSLFWLLAATEARLDVALHEKRTSALARLRVTRAVTVRAILQAHPCAVCGTVAPTGHLIETATAPDPFPLCGLACALEWARTHPDHVVLEAAPWLTPAFHLLPIAQRATEDGAPVLYLTTPETVPSGPWSAVTGGLVTPSRETGWILHAP